MFSAHGFLKYGCLVTKEEAREALADHRLKPYEGVLKKNPGLARLLYQQRFGPYRDAAVLIEATKEELLGVQRALQALHDKKWSYQFRMVFLLSPLMLLIFISCNIYMTYAAAILSYNEGFAAGAQDALADYAQGVNHCADGVGCTSDATPHSMLWLLMMGFLHLICLPIFMIMVGKFYSAYAFLREIRFFAPPIRTLNDGVQGGSWVLSLSCAGGELFLSSNWLSMIFFQPEGAVDGYWQALFEACAAANFTPISACQFGNSTQGNAATILPLNAAKVSLSDDLFTLISEPGRLTFVGLDLLILGIIAVVSSIQRSTAEENCFLKALANSLQNFHIWRGSFARRRSHCREAEALFGEALGADGFDLTSLVFREAGELFMAPIVWGPKYNAVRAWHAAHPAQNGSRVRENRYQNQNSLQEPLLQGDQGMELVSIPVR